MLHNKKFLQGYIFSISSPLPPVKGKEKMGNREKKGKKERKKREKSMRGRIMTKSAT